MMGTEPDNLKMHRSPGRCGRATALIAVLCSWLPAAAPAQAGVVQTRSGRLTGAVEVRPDALLVDGQSIPADQVLLVIFDGRGGTLRQPNTVRLAGGEVWHCEVLSLTGGKLKVHSPVFGTKEVDKSSVQALEFRAKLPEAGRLEEEVLYRQGGEPLPGKLLWIDERQVAVDSPLGAIAMDRQALTRFLFARKPAPPAGAGQADVILTDGTVLRGRLKLLREALAVEHEALGELRIAAGAVRAILCRPAWAAHLTELSFLAQSKPLLDGEAPKDLAALHAPDGTVAEEGGPVRSLVIQPETSVTFALTGSSGGKTVLRAMAAPVPGARGEARIRVLADQKTVAEAAVGPAQELPAPLEAQLGQAAELRIEVSFGSPLRLPCGVVLADPHLLAPLSGS